VADITYIRAAESWLYLCVVIDLYSWLVVGWSMSARQERELVLQAVHGAVATSRPRHGDLALRSRLPVQQRDYQRFLRGMTSFAA
jgi:putative transposase